MEEGTETKRQSCFVLFTFLIVTVSEAASCVPHVNTGTIRILSDGNITPPGTPITTTDRVTYALTASISDSISIERSNVLFDGAGYNVVGDDSGNGFSLVHVNNVTVKNVNLRNFTYGIYLESASTIIVEENNITSNNYDGIGEFYSNHATITRNNISSNGYDGIEIYNSTDNTISDNRITSNNWHGIGIYFSSANTISTNNLTNNLNGMEFAYCEDGTVFHNSFVSQKAQVTLTSSIAVWDDGYPSGGNYWGDNTNKTDNFRGRNQDQLGSDGIVDTGYTIDVNNVDHYPLTKPYGGLHDIGLAKGKTTKTVISQGNDLNITIIMINYGLTTETFNAAANFDTTQLVQTQITLTSRNSTSLSFTLNTTDFTKGNHTITAYADAVQNETDTTDNTLNSWIVITFLGDVNGDGRADMKDIAYVAKRFGSNPSSPLWDSNADMNDDDRVDMKDIAAVARNFGKTS